MDHSTRSRDAQEPATRIDGSQTGGLPVSPSLESVLQYTHVSPGVRSVLDKRVLWMGAVCIVLGVTAALAAQVLVVLIDLITNLAFRGRFSIHHASPAGNRLGVAVILIPMVGGLIVGLMARFGSRAIREHGIPETMEKILAGSSRIPARLTMLNPLSAAISIGTGGPFGAEGPIIATGGALGSLMGQIQSVTDNERKVLLSAGAAAGMAATFGAPVSAVLLAVELLLFEFRPRSVIPVALAATAATGVRIAFEGSHAPFAMADVAAPSGATLLLYVLIGSVMGVASVGVIRITFAIEDLFEKLPIHWMWWPAIGTLAVGVCGYFAPRTLGVGYDVITDMLRSSLTVGVVAWICAMKFISWSISLGSGTSGGALAPIFMIGGGLGTLLGSAAFALFPLSGVDVRVAALVGMAALFAGASQALLAAVVFAFEVTLQPTGLLPLLGACAASYMISALLMRESIMTEKLARRGLRVPNEYAADVLDGLWVRNLASKKVVTRRDFLPPRAAGRPRTAKLRELIRRPPIIVYEDCTLRDAIDHMVRHDVGRLPVTRRDNSGEVVGIITRSNILAAHRSRILEMEREEPGIRKRGIGQPRPASAAGQDSP